MRFFPCLWMLSFALLTSLIGCATSPNPKKIPLTHTDHTIHFIYHEWHTSILIETDTYARYSKFFPESESLQEQLQQQKYVRIGWGDGDYFTGKRKTFGAATKALIASDYSAIQIMGYAQDPFLSIPTGTRVPLVITDKSMRRLVRYIDKSFLHTAAGDVIALPSYVENAGTFYQAQGHYSLLSNCNTWSGRALQVAGLPIRSRLHLTARSVFEQAQTVSLYQQQNLAVLMPE